VGLDRSLPLLGRAAAARRAAGGGEELVRGDLRALPFAPAAFAGALSMFTSLGYFEDEGENQRMLEEVARVVRGGGAFLVDYLNAAALERALVPASTRVAGRYRVEEKRRIDRARRRIIKEVAIFGEPGGAALKRHVESVALWSQRELEDRLGAAGFRARARAGDYDGQPFAPLSPRLLVLAVREE
jgi:SAM-dependent methyltransferase